MVKKIINLRKRLDEEEEKENVRTEVERIRSKYLASKLKEIENNSIKIFSLRP